MIRHFSRITEDVWITRSNEGGQIFNIAQNRRASKNLVMFLEDAGIYIDVTFLSWSEGKRGGFSYERSTP